MNKPTVYLAGPISGLSYEEATFGWRKDFAEELEPYDIEVYSPMRGKKHLAGIKNIAPSGRYQDTIMSSPKGILMRDMNDVRNRDMIVFNLLGAKRVSIGTMFEYGWATAFHKPIVTIVEEDWNNPHDHDFVREVSLVVHSVSDAVDVVAAFLKGGHS